MKKIIGIIFFLAVSFAAKNSYAQSFDDYFAYGIDTTLTYKIDTIEVYWNVSIDSSSRCLTISETTSTSTFPLNYELCQIDSTIILRTDFGNDDMKEETILIFSIPFVLGETKKSNSHSTTVYKHLASLQIRETQFQDVFILKNEWLGEGDLEDHYYYISRGHGFIQFEGAISGKISIVR